jgi:pantothenate kinase
MPQPLHDPVAHVVSLLQHRPSRVLVGLAGVPGAGKSTLAQQLSVAVNVACGTDCCVALGMDGFHLSKAQLAQFPDPALALARRGAPWTFDASGFRERVTMLRSAAGRHAVTWPDFAHEVGDPVPDAISVAADVRVVIVEGLYLLHQADGWHDIDRLFDERWFLDTPFSLSMERLARRHMQAWGFTRAQAEQRIASSDGLNAQLVQESALRADWLVYPTV